MFVKKKILCYNECIRKREEKTWQKKLTRKKY